MAKKLHPVRLDDKVKENGELVAYLQNRSFNNYIETLMKNEANSKFYQEQIKIFKKKNKNWREILNEFFKKKK